MSDWLPSLNGLRAFEALSRHLSYREAADELHVTPAAVKQLVSKLEESLETRLVQRQGRGLRLTRAGIAGRSNLQGAFKQLTAAVQKMRTTVRRQTMTISVEPSFATSWLVPRLNAFKVTNPDIDVLIDSSLRVVDLDREAADIGIRYGVKPGRDHLAYRLFDDEIMAVCSPSLAEGPPALERLEDLAKVPLLHIDMSELDWMSPSTEYWFDWDHWLVAVGAGGVRPGEGLRFNDYNLAVQAAIAGQGVVLGSLPIVMGALDAGLLLSPFSVRAKTDTGYDLVTTKQAMARPEVAKFVEWILEELGSTPV